MTYKAFDLTGKTALITGGNNGIGLGFAEALAQSGATVCIWGTNAEKNEAALKQILSHGGKALPLRRKRPRGGQVVHTFLIDGGYSLF